MITISLCMIVKNEEDVLGRCLSSVKDLVDEIIIVDTGSSDRTRQTASDFTEHIFSFEWTDDFSAARNFAFSKASMDYCMWLDADDVAEAEEHADFLALKHSLTLQTDIVMMRYNTAFDENGSPSFWYYRERLIRNNGSFLWHGAVHEAIPPRGNILYSDISISHRKIHPGDPDRNLNIYRKLLSAGKQLDARESYYYARELYYHKLYGESLSVFQKFLSAPEAWIENKIEACLIMAQCYLAEGDRASSLEILFRSLAYDVPRAEVCCEIGSHFMASGQYETAVFWFQTALHCRADYKKGGFILPDCHNYIPSLQLCVCYDKLGRYEKAKKYNDKAGTFKPASSAYLYNKAYFDKIL